MREKERGQPEQGLEGEKGEEQRCIRVVRGFGKTAFCKKAAGVTGQTAEGARFSGFDNVPAYSQLRP